MQQGRHTNGEATETLEVAGGSTVGFTLRSSTVILVHVQSYLAKVLEGQSAASWDGAGLETVEVQLPSPLPLGEYLLRVEHTALHSAFEEGGTQFYISCAQINVTGGGNGEPGPNGGIPWCLHAA
ncbi:hypothetical protein AJ80_01779 [Polytolypa hystricis UAMH7299]|uniref:lytic cellulose monooxygenase (C4-dehydrogenating) n=1 Tax=Polytolypa hystricis (strain UAMH7299) TaxID=1447883 RepID=A0A2B7YXT0_POLH7|nr:hypothetical protein AJ80_01779 [Polytolypa hystricis UAMH7299]